MACCRRWFCQAGFVETLSSDLGLLTYPNQIGGKVISKLGGNGGSGFSHFLDNGIDGHGVESIAGNRGLDVNRLHSKKLYLIRTPRKAPIWQPGTGYYRGRVGRTRSPPLKPKKRASPHSNLVSLHRPQAAPGSATPATEEKLKFGKLKAEIRKTENWKPASEGKSGLEKNQPRNHKSVGKAATVAGDVGPGFHTWPTGHIPQDNGYETANSQPVPCKEDVRIDVRRRDRGQRPQLQKKSGYWES